MRGWNGALATLRDMSMAPADLDGCAALLQSIAHTLDADQGVMILRNPLTTQLEFVLYNQGPEACRQYAEHYWTLDPTRLPHWILCEDDTPSSPGIDSVFDLRDVLDYRELVASEFYNDFLRPFGIYHDLVTVASAGSLARATVCLHRERARKAFSEEEAGLMRLLAPFVRNHIERMVGATVLSALPHTDAKGVIVCDAQGRVLYSNDIARGLCHPDAAETPSLLLGEQTRAIGGQVKGARTTSGTMADTKTSFVGYAIGDPQALAEQSHLHVDSHPVLLEQERPGWLITLQPDETSKADWAERLKERFAMTDREIEVLDAVMSGRTNREIAQSLFVAESTVKKHMQNICTKVGARTRTAVAHVVRHELGMAP